jgi:hypothetical protein
MAKTEEQDLIDRIARLDWELKKYKHAIANPPSWVDTKFLTDTIVQLEAEIGELNTQLEAYQLIEIIFDLVTQPPLPGRGKMVKTIQNSKLSI